MSDVLIRYLHFLGIIVLASSLAIEHMQLKGVLKIAQLRKLAMIDVAYGVSAIIILTAGLLMWFAGLKSPDFYSLNWVFHIKVGLFVLIGLLSIYPTVWLIKNRRCPDDEIVVPRLIVNLVRLELLLLVLMPLLAVMMARGIGLG